MTDIYFDEHAFVSAAEAARLSGFTRDYIAMLCRRGSVRGRRVGRNWYVEEDAFKSYLILQEYGRSKRRQELTNERRVSYTKGSVSHPASSLRSGIRSAVSDIRSAPGAVAPIVHMMHEHMAKLANAPAGATDAIVRTVPAHAISPVNELLHKLVALTAAFMLTFGVYAVADPDASAFAADQMRETARRGAAVFAAPAREGILAAAGARMRDGESYFRALPGEFRSIVEEAVYGFAFFEKSAGRHASEQSSVAIELAPHRASPTICIGSTCITESELQELLALRATSGGRKVASSPHSTSTSLYSSSLTAGSATSTQ